jgi:hypothetical protein
MGVASNEWITLISVPVSTIGSELSQLLFQRYGFSESGCKRIINSYFQSIRCDLTITIELPYVDKVFRNSYYHYYSSKHHRYERDCIRLSLFEGNVIDPHFDSCEFSEALISAFLGVIIIRPTYPQLFGRTLLSPKAFKQHDFAVCLTKASCSINGIKFHIDAFPHASQDSEHLTCAETSIWSIMEYFGHTYPDYIPALPSDIITALSNPAFERVVPSHGLSVTQISFALKQFGFGPRIYSHEAYLDREADFRRILSWYVESGIPVIVALENGSTGHAVLFIGHENISGSYQTWLNSSDPQADGRIADTGDFDKRYIVIDDNYPPYQSCTFDSPTSYYTSPAFKGFRITAFVVPLHPRVYLEPFEAYCLALHVLKNIIGVPSDTRSIITRFFLTSSRSYKNWIYRSSYLQKDLRNIILTNTMPKFIWVMELSDRNRFSDCTANGMILIDATGDDSLDSVLLFAHAGKVFLRVNGIYKDVETGFTDFPCYENNLKGEWSGWKA